MKILIIEDDAVSWTILTTILAKMPEHHVAAVESAERAWEWLDDPGRSFDVAFLDIVLPKLSGLDLLARLKESAFHRSLQVIMCTAANDRTTITKAIELGAKHYLVKPFSEAAVVAKLQQIMGTAKTSAR